MPEINLVGRVIDGKYPLLEALENSEAGEVYRTQLPGADSRRAQIHLRPASEEQAAAWKLAGTFRHRHLQEIFAGGRAEVDGRKLLYLVTEMPEERLSQVLPDRPLTPEEANEMLPPIVAALGALHSAGAVHTAVRPANVLVIGDQVKLAIASVVARGTASGKTVRDGHDAPEAGMKNASPAMDLWALGATLVEALTRKIPASASEIPSSLPKPLETVARKCLEKDPAMRGTLDDIRAILKPGAGPQGVAKPAVGATAVPRVVAEDPRPARKAAIRPEPIVQPKRTTPMPAGSPVHAQNRLLLFVGGGAILLILLFVVLFHGHKSTPTSSTSPAPQVIPSGPLPVTPVGPQAGLQASSHGSVANRVMPDVSDHAVKTIRGTLNVAIQVEVDSDGRVTSASIESRSHSRYFAERGLEAAKGWTFNAPRAGGQPQASVWDLRFEFKRNGTAVNASQVRP